MWRPFDQEMVTDDDSRSMGVQVIRAFPFGSWLEVEISWLIQSLTDKRNEETGVPDRRYEFTYVVRVVDMFDGPQPNPAIQVRDQFTGVPPVPIAIGETISGEGVAVGQISTGAILGGVSLRFELVNSPGRWTVGLGGQIGVVLDPEEQ